MLSKHVEELRNPVRAAELLEEPLQQNPNYCPVLRGLAIVSSARDDGVRNVDMRLSSCFEEPRHLWLTKEQPSHAGEVRT